MTRSGSVFVLACAVLLGGAVASAVMPPAAYGGDEVKKMEKLKKARDAFRKKQKDDGKMPFYDLSYAADPGAVKESRWSQTDPPPFNELSEEKGGQFFAAWSPDIQKGTAIEVMAIKYIHKSPDGKSKYTMNFEKAGLTCATSEKDKMLNGSYLDEKRGMTDVVDKKCVEPRKKKCGPAEAFASVVGTSSESKKRERKDFYMWTDANCTWILKVTIHEKYLDDPLIMEKAEEFIGTIKGLKAPD